MLDTFAACNAPPSIATLLEADGYNSSAIAALNKSQCVALGAYVNVSGPNASASALNASASGFNASGLNANGFDSSDIEESSTSPDGFTSPDGPEGASSSTV